MFYIHYVLYSYCYLDIFYLTMRNLIVALYGRAMMQYITKMSLIFAWNCPDYTQTFFEIFLAFLGKLCPNYAPTMPQLCPARLCFNYAPTISLPQLFPEFCLNYAPTMFRQTTDLPIF